MQCEHTAAGFQRFLAYVFRGSLQHLRRRTFTKGKNDWQAIISEKNCSISEVKQAP
jgi:hypothetical protein